jgi:hypothetical protein
MPLRTKSLFVKGPLSTPVVRSRQVTHPWAILGGACQHHGHWVLAIHVPDSTAKLWHLGLVTQACNPSVWSWCSWQALWHGGQVQPPMLCMMCSCAATCDDALAGVLGVQPQAQSVAVPGALQGDSRVLVSWVLMIHG